MQIEMIRDDVLFFSGNSSYGNSEKKSVSSPEIVIVGNHQ